MGNWLLSSSVLGNFGKWTGIRLFHKAGDREYELQYKSSDLQQPVVQKKTIRRKG